MMQSLQEKVLYFVKRRGGIGVTLAGEAVVIWTATGLSVVAMKVAEKWGRVFHIGFHVLLCTQRSQARSYTFYVMC